MDANGYATSITVSISIIALLRVLRLKSKNYLLRAQESFGSIFLKLKGEKNVFLKSHSGTCYSMLRVPQYEQYAPPCKSVRCLQSTHLEEESWDHRTHNFSWRFFIS